jgi:hypothetical protein
MKRPREIGGMTAIEVLSMHKAIADNLTQAGEHFFKARELMDCFGLAYTAEETTQAISDILSFNKWLNSLDCQMQDIGFRELDRANLKFAFTYSVQSRKHDNAPLMVNEMFTLQVPLLALATETARIWSMAYKKVPRDDIRMVAEGK